jgi:tryptophanyl-tRNA synthetase
MEKLYIQDGDVKREYTEAEYAQNAIDVAEYNAAVAAAEAEAEALATAKADAIDKLTALGIDPKALGLVIEEKPIEA